MQLGGWFSLMFIEIFNFTFFIRGEFKWSYLYAFGIFPIIGIVTTHFYKIYFIPPTTFSKPMKTIWIKALLDIVLISFLMLVLARIIPIITGDQTLFTKSLSEILASIGPQYLNIARYILVWIIIYYLFHLLQRRNEILQEKLETEIYAKTTELELLKSQLNPSFLFNALSSIKALVLKNQDKARESIVQLSELLRYSLNYDKNSLVPLGEELQELKKYIALESIRLGQNLSYSIEIKEEQFNTLIPTASLINLIEYAIKHGIETLENGGTIVLTSITKQKTLTFQLVADSQSPDHLSSVKLLENLDLRLSKIYGESAELQFLRSNPMKIILNLSIPYL